MVVGKGRESSAREGRMIADLSISRDERLHSCDY